MQTYTIDIRPRRQATFPQELLGRVGVDVGDAVVAEAKKNMIILKPQKQVFLNLFKEIQRIVKESGVPETELQGSAREYRRQKSRSYASSNIS